MLKKISLPVLLTVMCLMVMVVIGLFFLNKNKGIFTKKTVTNKTEEVKITRTNYSETARKTLDWIDQQRNEAGWYILARGCDYEKKTCDTVWENDEGNKDGLITTWARFNFYQQTKNLKDLEIVKSDINKFYEKYPKGVDNALWICKITYDMWRSDLFDEETKDKLEKICFESEMPEVVLNKNNYTQRLEKVSAGMKEGVPAWKTWAGYSLGLRGVDSYFGLTSDLMSQYQWKKDETKLALAKKYFESAKEIIGQMDVSTKAEDECLTGLAAIDLYEFGSKDESYLNYAKEKYLAFYYKKGSIKKYRTTICGLFSKRLYQISKDDLFLDGVEKNNKVLVEGLLDSEGSMAKTTGEEGFYMASIGGGGFPVKNVAENGLIVELIRN